MVVRPHWNQTVVVAPAGLMVPFRVAERVAIAVAGSVATWSRPLGARDISHVALLTNVPVLPLPVPSAEAVPVPSSKRQQPIRPDSAPVSAQFIVCCIWVGVRATFQMRISSKMALA